MGHSGLGDEILVDNWAQEIQQIAVHQEQLLVLEQIGVKYRQDIFLWPQSKLTERYGHGD